MEEISNLTQVSFASLRAMGIEIMAALPNIIAAIILLLVGWVVARIVSKIIIRIFNTQRFKSWTDKLNNSEALDKSDIHINPGKIIGKFVYWVIMLIFIITATETLGWDAVSKEVGGLVRYLPKLFSAIVIFMIGLYIASFIKQAIHATFSSFGISGAKIISKIVFYIILIILSVTAMNQAGINTTIITNNITLILGSVLFSFALAFGFGSRDIIQNMLSSLYSKRSFVVGDKVVIGDVEGTIETIESMNVTIKTEKGKVILPSHDMVKQKVEVRN